VVPGIQVDADAVPEGAFVLGNGGQTPLAFTESHGAWVHWLDRADT
jgi:hypothetical protein